MQCGNRPRHLRRPGRPIGFQRRTRAWCVPGRDVMYCTDQQHMSCSSKHTLNAFSVVNGICCEQTVFLASCGVSCQPVCLPLAWFMRRIATIELFRSKYAVTYLWVARSFQERLRTSLRNSGGRPRRLPRASRLLSAV